MPSIFVAVPTRNRPVYVREALSSLLAQTNGDFRALVSDNASEAEASASVESFVRDLGDPRIRYVRQPENVGEYGQGRFFLAECREEFLIFLHDDDRLEPRFLEVAMAKMRATPGADCFVANPYVFTTEGGRSEKLTSDFLRAHGRDRYSEGEIDVLESLLRCGFIPISGAFFRAGSLRASGFVDEDCHGNYPFEFNVLLRLGANGAKAHFHPETLLGIRFHEGSLRSTMNLRFNEHVISTTLRLLERHRFHGVPERLRRKTLSYNYRNLAMIHLGRGRGEECARLLRLALASNPWSYRNWTYSAGALLFPFLLRPRLRSRIAPVSIE